MKRKKNLILTLIIIVFSLVIIGTVAYVFVKTVSDNNSRDNYENLAGSYAADVTQSATAIAATAPTIDIKAVENPIDFKTLTAKNSDIYSWIYIPDTNINYPVCQSRKNDNFYLNHDINMNYSYAGAIYSQFCNKTDYSDRVTVLYGHNMANCSMFANLHKFRDKSFFDKHKYMYIYTKDRKLTYEVVSAFEYDNRHIMNSFDFSNDKVFEEYLDMICNPHSLAANIRNDLNLTVADNILTLSTCLDSGEGRYLVQGVLVKDEQTK